MKVASNELLPQKCDSSVINDFDVTYMNKLNETLNANVDLVTASDTNNGNSESTDFARKIKDNGISDSCDPKENSEIAIGIDETTSTRNALPIEASVLNGKGDGDLKNLYRPNSESGLDSATSSWDKSVTEIKEHAYSKLEEELQRAREILKLRDEEVSRLRKMRQDGDNELLELTASLFEVSENVLLFSKNEVARLG